jgi:hypothetical protein
MGDGSRVKLSAKAPDYPSYASSSEEGGRVGNLTQEELSALTSSEAREGGRLARSLSGGIPCVAWWFGTFIGASLRFIGLRNQACSFVIMKNYIEQRTVDP